MRRNLALFNKMMRKKENTNASPSTPVESTATSPTTKSTSTTSPGFGVHAYKNGMVPPSRSRPPTNLEDIYKRYNQRRRTASPTESIYRRYVDRIGNAVNEATMVFEAGGKLLQEYDDKGYQRAFDQSCTAFPKDVGFNNGLSTLQPGFVEGPRMDGFLPFPVDEYIRGAVLYQDDPRSVTLLHLAGEWKGRGKNMEKAAIQAGYDGAALVYARNQALSYLGKPDPPGHAEVTTFATDGTTFDVFAHYAIETDDGTLEYHQYPIKTTNLLEPHRTFGNGQRGLRNMQDHAFELLCNLRDQFKEYYRKWRDDSRSWFAAQGGSTSRARSASGSAGTVPALVTRINPAGGIARPVMGGPRHSQRLVVKEREKERKRNS